MACTMYANLEVYEDNTSSLTDITFKLKPRKVIITNDSTTDNLQFRFNTAFGYATLHPTETITLEITSRNLFLIGTNVDYRIWGIG